jgi:hypothetical protein
MKKVVLATGTWLIASATLFAAGMAYDENFIVYAENESLAAEILRHANAYRSDIATELLGDEIPPGLGRTVIHARISEREDNGLTWPIDCPERRLHAVWVTSEKGALANLLKHEIAHTVMATRYPGQLPPWAEEGIASRYDDARRVAIRERILEWFAATGNWPSVERVLSDPLLSRSEQASYAAASSLTDFLLTHGDHETLFAFAAEGRRDSWEKSLRRHYRFGSVADLEKTWRAWLTQLLGKEKPAVRTFVGRR